MEATSIQRYLECYNNLNKPSLSKTANKQLLQLQSSLEAWSIAYQLINYPDPQLQLHGAQLLSKKLNTPPQKDVNLEPYLHFIMEKSQKNQVLWLCLAKIIIHLSSNQPELPRNLPPDQILCLLREIPAALTHVHIQPPVDLTEMKKQYLKMATPLLKSEMSNHSDLVLQVIDSFVSYGAKIQDPTLVKFLLNQPFEESEHILEDVIGRSFFPQLHNELISYLQSHRNDDSALGLHIAFFRNAKVSSLSFEQLRSSLAYIITCLSQEDSESGSRVSQSYQFWLCISKQIKQGEILIQAHQILQQAFLTLWKLTCEKSMYRQMPERSIAGDRTLSIDVDDDQNHHKSTPETNKDAEYFRNYAGDFFVLCLETLAVFPQALQQLFNSLENLSSSEILHLQLSVFIVYSLTPCKSELLFGISQTIRNIFARSSEMNEYLCSKVIDLIGELSPLLSLVSDLLMPMLIFLSNSLMYPGLATVAAVSCCNLLEQVDESKNAVAQSMQQFLTHAYQIIFRQDTQIKVIQNLTKAMTIFIYKFKHTAQDYRSYLDIFHQRCSKLALTTRCRLIQAVISGQIWINCQEEGGQIKSVKSNNYAKPFGEYLEKQVQTFLEGIQNVEKKKQFKEIIVLINLAIKTNSIQGNGEIWCHLCDHILSKYLSIHPPLQITITPLINLLQCSIEIQNPSLCTSVSLLSQKWHPSINQLLDHTFNNCQFSLTSTVLNLNLKIVQFLKKYPQHQQTIDYQPQSIVTYITGIIMRQDIWEYEVFKFGLNYLLIVVQLGYPPKDVLICLLSSFGKLQESLWTSLNPILFEIHKCHGFFIYNEALRELNSPLADQSNPLNSVLVNSFKNGDGKTIKNIFLAL